MKLKTLLLAFLMSNKGVISHDSTGSVTVSLLILN